MYYKFWKAQCPGCYALTRTISSLESKLEGVEIIEKNVEVPENKELAKKYGLDVVPALVRISDGKMLVGGKLKRDEVLLFLKGE